MLKKFILIYSILAVTLLFAISEPQIKSVMSQKVQEITTLLQDKSLEKESKQNSVYAIIDSIFDYKIMSKVSLGKEWKNFTEKQKEEFIAKYEYKLKASYFDKLELYTDEKVLIKEIEKVKSNRIKVHSDIIGKDDIYEVIYKFYKAKESSDWLIYDVEITGVSIIQTYRKQFSEFLRSKSIDKLIESL